MSFYATTSIVIAASYILVVMICMLLFLKTPNIGETDNNNEDWNS